MAARIPKFLIANCDRQSLVRGRRREHVFLFSLLIGSTLPAWLSARFPRHSCCRGRLWIQGDCFQPCWGNQEAQCQTYSRKTGIIGMFFQSGVGVVHVLFVPSLWSIKQNREVNSAERIRYFEKRIGFEGWIQGSLLVFELSRHDFSKCDAVLWAQDLEWSVDSRMARIVGLESADLGGSRNFLNLIGVKLNAG